MGAFPLIPFLFGGRSQRKTLPQRFDRSPVGGRSPYTLYCLLLEIQTKPETEKQTLNYIFIGVRKCFCVLKCISLHRYIYKRNNM